jgi:F-type H+-transporting ATPase subunit b
MDKLVNQFESDFILWQILIFVGLILLLKKFLKPILTAVNDREEGIKSAPFLCRKCKERKCKLSRQSKTLAEASRTRNDDERSS